MAWTVDRVAEFLSIESAQAEQIIGLVRGTVDPLSLPGMAQWARSRYHAPNSCAHDTRMRAIAEVLDAYPSEPEAIRGTRQDDRYWGDTVAIYIAMGDTYNATILYDAIAGRYRLTTMGEFVERFDRCYGVI